MANRYWVGGSGTWSTTNTANWSATSGGAGGASVPTSVDDVFFDSGSNATGYSLQLAGNQTLVCRSLSMMNPASGVLTLIGTIPSTLPTLQIYGSLSVGSISYATNSGNGFNLQFLSTSTGNTINVAAGLGFPYYGNVTFNGVGGGWTLQTNYSAPGGSVHSTSLLAGTLNLNGFTFTGDRFYITGSLVRQLNLTNSTLNGGAFNVSGTNYTITTTGSTINLGIDTWIPNQSFGGLSYNNVNISTTAATNFSISDGNNSFANLSMSTLATGTFTLSQSNIITTLTLTGGSFTLANTQTIGTLNLQNASGGYYGTALTSSANQTIGALNITPGSVLNRIRVASSTIGTPVTFNVTSSANVSDCDFRDIAIIGAVSPLSGTRLGDLRGNSGITFASKTVYWNLGGAGALDWTATAWANTSGGTPAANNYPLPQDTAIFDNNSALPTTKIDITRPGRYKRNLPGIDMSAKTSYFRIQLWPDSGDGTGSCNIYGDLIYGTTNNIDNNGQNNSMLYFAGRKVQNIQTNGLAPAYKLGLDSPGGTLRLLDNLTTGTDTGGPGGYLYDFEILNGTLDLNGKTLSVPGSVAVFNVYSTGTSGMIFNGGTLSLGCPTFQNFNPNFIAAEGSAPGTINLTSASPKTFAGGGVRYGCTLNQGGAGTLTITGSNYFNNITNTYGATGSANITFTASTTTYCANFTASGTVGKVLTLNSTSAAKSTLYVYNRPSTLNYISATNIISSRVPLYVTANSTVTTSNNVFASSYVAPTPRYWVGGAGTWNATSNTNWSSSSGGANGASVPYGDEDAIFDQAGTYAVTLTGSIQCANLSVTSGTVTFTQGTTPSLTIGGSYQVIAGTSWSFAAAGNPIAFNSASNTNVITQNGTNFSLYNPITFDGINARWTLGSAFRAQNTVSVLSGTFDTSSSNYSFNDANLRLLVNGGTFSGGNSTISMLTANVVSGIFTSNAATISVTTTTTLFGGTVNLGSSTWSLGAATTIPLDVISTTINAANSTITYSQSTVYDVTINAGSKTYNNFNITLHPSKTVTLNGQNIFNNLSINKNASTNGRNIIFIGANNTVSNTFTLNSLALHNRRTVIRSSVPGTQRVLTVNSFSANSSDVDFADISVTGAAAPISGDRYGDLKNNSGITFSSPRTVYWNLAGTQNWEATAWANTSGGTPAANNFPLAQDTAIFDDVGSAGTVTLGAWDVGTINMSGRVANTITFATTTPTIYGNWINGSNTTLSGTGAVTFSGRTTQTITSSGKTFTQALVVDTLGGTVQLSDAFISTNSFTLTNGTFTTNNYNFTSDSFSSNNSNTRSLVFGANSTFTLTGSYVWDTSAILNFTPTSSNTNNMIVICTGTGALRATSNNLVNVRFKPTTAVTTGKINIDLGTTNSWSNLDLSAYAGSINRAINTPAVPLTVYGDFDMGTVVMGDQSFGTGQKYRVNCIANRPNNILNTRGKATGTWSLSAVNPQVDGYSLQGTLTSYSPWGNFPYTDTSDIYIDCKLVTNNNTIYANQAQGYYTTPRSAELYFTANADVTCGSSSIVAGNQSQKNWGYIWVYSGAKVNMGSSAWTSYYTIQFQSGCTITAGTSSMTIQSIYSSTAPTFANGGYALNSLTINPGSSVNFGASISGAGSYNAVSVNCRAASSISGATSIGTLDTYFITDSSMTLSSSCNIGTFNARTPTTVSASCNLSTFNILSTSATLNATCNTANLTLSGSMPSLTINANQNVTNLTSVGGVGPTNSRYRIYSGTPFPRKLTANGTINVSDTTFYYIDAQGPSVPITGNRISVIGGTTNITQSTPKTVYWRLSSVSAGDMGAIAWANTAGGTPDANNYPLIQDTAVITNFGLTAGGTFTFNGDEIGGLDLSSRTTALTLSLAGIQTYYGNVSFGSGVSFTGSADTIFANDDLKTLTASGQTFPQNLRIEPQINPYWKSPNWANVVMYLTAATSGTNFGDFSANASVVTTSGTVSSSGTDPYGLPTIFLQTTPRMYVASKADRACSGDFTFEFSLYSTAVATTYATPMCLNRAAVTGDFSAYAGTTIGGKLSFGITNGPSAQTAASIHNSTWHHFAVVRSGSTIKFYQNGIDIGNAGSNTYSGVCDFGSTVEFLLGAWWNGQNDNLWTGYVSEVTLTKGVAKYTSNFTPTKIATNVGGIDMGSAITTSNNLSHNAGQISSNYNVTAATFASLIANYKSILLGSGTWTLTGTGTVWSITGSNTNTTLIPGSSNILINNNTTTARGFNGAGFTYSKLTIGGANTTTFTISGNNTFNTLSSTKTVAHTIVFPNANTTITNWAVSGSNNNVVTLSRTGASGRFSLVKTNSAVVKANYLSISNSTVYPTKVWYAGRNSTDGGNTTNWLFTNAPSSGFTMFF